MLRTCALVSNLATIGCGGGFSCWFCVLTTWGLCPASGTGWPADSCKACAADSCTACPAASCTLCPLGSLTVCPVSCKEDSWSAGPPDSATPRAPASATLRVLPPADTAVVALLTSVVIPVLGYYEHKPVYWINSSHFYIVLPRLTFIWVRMRILYYANTIILFV